jgi:hypothetical protein
MINNQKNAGVQTLVAVRHEREVFRISQLGGVEYIFMGDAEACQRASNDSGLVPATHREICSLVLVEIRLHIIDRRVPQC